MAGIGIKLSAKNSSGEQTLYMQKSDGGYHFALCGTFEGKPIQIDFDESTRAELEDIKAAIEIMLDDNACQACNHNGQQTRFPSDCTGCGADGEALNFEPHH